MLANAKFAPLSDEEVRRAPLTSHGDDWTPILPVRHADPGPTRQDFERFAPRGYRYGAAAVARDASGRPLYWEARYISETEVSEGGKPKKQYRPVTLCRHKQSGAVAFRCKAPPQPRPLYGLDRLAASPNAAVIVTEGPRKAKAASDGFEGFEGFVGVSAMSGASGAAASDWSPLAGRRVIVWPDNDAISRDRFVSDVAAQALAAGAASVSVVSVPETWPEKWDLADALPEGASGADLARLIAGARPYAAVTALRDGWEPPKPIAATLPPVEAFCPEMLPQALRRYVMDVSDRQQCPPDFAAVSTICALAGIIGHKVRICPKQHDDWTVVPTLWGAIIGRPRHRTQSGPP